MEIQQGYGISFACHSNRQLNDKELDDAARTFADIMNKYEIFLVSGAANPFDKKITIKTIEHGKTV